MIRQTKDLLLLYGLPVKQLPLALMRRMYAVVVMEQEAKATGRRG